MRLLLLLVAVLIPSTAIAGTTPGYYGPKQGGQGYKDEMRPDGYWKIEAATSGRMLAVDMAIYRAAELARARGDRFVEIHDVYATEDRVRRQTATLFARPAAAAAHPSACRSGKRNRCYTADVAVVLKRLSGASGREPGMAATTSIDAYGRTVYESGYGTGSISPLGRAD